MNKSYLFVESPLQLLNAYEAIAKFNLQNYEIIVRLSNHKENDKQIKFLIDYLKLKNINNIIINGDKKTLADYMKILYYQIKYKFISIDKIFIGNYESGFFKQIMKQFNRDKIILLDDGAKTLFIQKQFSNNNFYNLFTMYDLNPINNNQIIYKNSFEELNKKLIKMNFNREEIFFLGMKLNEIGIVSEETYVKFIEKISKKYKKQKIIYIVHRGESENKLKKIQSIGNIEIRSYSFPIELVGFFEKNIPKKVISFYSTALLTMKYIYNIEVESYIFDYNNSKYKIVIDEVYNYYKQLISVKEII